MPNTNEGATTPPKKPAKKAAAKPKAAPAKTTAASAAAPSGSSAPGVSAADWQLVQQVAKQYGIDPYVLVAIGMHETGWGTQGAGRQGYTLGVGVPDSGGLQTQYQGLQAQLEGAAQILNKYGVHTIHDLSTGVLAPHNGQVRYASGAGWTQGVVASYNQVRGTKFTAATSTAAGTSDLTPSQPLTVDQYLSDPAIQQQYGYLVGFAKDPEVGPILAKAAAGGWGTDELLGALSKTHWWQTTSDSSRLWQELQKTDPASAKQQFDQMAAKINGLAQLDGLTLQPGHVRRIANAAIGSNWSDLQLQTAIAAEFHYQPGVAYKGQVGTTLQTLKSYAAQYLVPISDQTLGQWTQQVLGNPGVLDSFKDYLAQQAKSLYPTLTKAIDSGVSVRQYLDPYAQTLQQTLGINPEGIDWMDPKWSKALNTTTPDGQRAPMSLSDWGSYLRGLPEYQTTDNARASAATLGLKIAQTFGRVAV